MTAVQNLTSDDETTDYVETPISEETLENTDVQEQQRRAEEHDGGYGWVCVVCQLMITASTWGVNGVSPWHLENNSKTMTRYFARLARNLTNDFLHDRLSVSTSHITSQQTPSPARQKSPIPSSAVSPSLRSLSSPPSSRTPPESLAQSLLYLPVLSWKQLR